MSEEAQVAMPMACVTNMKQRKWTYIARHVRPTACTVCIKTDHQGHDFDTIPKLSRKIKNRRPDLLMELQQKMNPIKTKNRRHLRI